MRGIPRSFPGQSSNDVQKWTSCECGDSSNEEWWFMPAYLSIPLPVKCPSWLEFAGKSYRISNSQTLITDLQLYGGTRLRRNRRQTSFSFMKVAKNYKRSLPPWVVSEKTYSHEFAHVCKIRKLLPGKPVDVLVWYFGGKLASWSSTNLIKRRSSVQTRQRKSRSSLPATRTLRNTLECHKASFTWIKTPSTYHHMTKLIHQSVKLYMPIW